MKPRVILADDHTMLVEAFATLLEPECTIVAQVGDGLALLEAATRLKPDIVVMDVAMPLLNGLDAARQLKKRMPDIRLIFVTMSEDSDIAAEAFRAGASGYLLKRSASAELLVAIREVMNRRHYVTPFVTRELVGSFINGPEATAGRSLTARQRGVLQLLAEGRSMKEAASILNVSVRTIAFHKYRMMEQLDIETTAELVQYAVREHLV